EAADAEQRAGFPGKRHDERLVVEVVDLGEIGEVGRREPRLRAEVAAVHRGRAHPGGNVHQAAAAVGPDGPPHRDRAVATLPPRADRRSSQSLAAAETGARRAATGRVLYGARRLLDGEAVGLGAARGHSAGTLAATVAVERGRGHGAGRVVSEREEARRWVC